MCCVIVVVFVSVMSKFTLIMVSVAITVVVTGVVATVVVVVVMIKFTTELLV